MQYSIFDSTVKVYGVSNFRKNRKLEKFPEDIGNKIM